MRNKALHFCTVILLITSVALPANAQRSKIINAPVQHIRVVPQLYIINLPRRLYARAPDDLPEAGKNKHRFIVTNILDKDKSGMLPDRYQDLLRDEFNNALRQQFKLSRKMEAQIGFHTDARTEAYDEPDPNRPYRIGINGAELAEYLNESLKYAVVDNNLNEYKDALRFVIAHEYSHLRQHDAFRTKLTVDQQDFAQRIAKVPEALAMSRRKTLAIMTSATKDTELTDDQVPDDFDEENTRRLECQADILGGLFTYQRLDEEMQSGRSADLKHVGQQMDAFMDVIASLESSGSHPNRIQREQAAREGEYLIQWHQAEQAKQNSMLVPANKIIENTIEDTAEDFANHAAFYRDVVLRVKNGDVYSMSETLDKAERIIRYPEVLLGSIVEPKVETRCLLDSKSGSIQPYTTSAGQVRYRRQYPYSLTFHNKNLHRSVKLSVQIDWFDKIPYQERRYGPLRQREIFRKDLKPGETFTYPQRMITYDANADERQKIVAGKLDEFDPPVPVISLSADTPAAVRVPIDTFAKHLFGKKALYSLRGVLETGKQFSVEWDYERREAQNYSSFKQQPLIVRPNTTKAIWGEKQISVTEPFPIWQDHIWAEPAFFNTVFEGRFNPVTQTIDLVR